MTNGKIFDQVVGSETLKVELTGPEDCAPDIFSLHGAGPSNRVRAQYIADFMSARSRSMLRFDFSGQGDSSGEMSGSSLSKRLFEAKSVAAHLSKENPAVLIGTSMGAHIAVKLLPHIPVKSLILFCPAAYAAEAEDIPFTTHFTDILRQPASWKSSEIWNILSDFTGNVALFIGSEDAIIPDGVIEAYLSFCRHARSLYYRRIEGAPHNLHDWLGKHPDYQEKVLSEIERVF
jgi:pimeloyl-ACP methyl ester carboxylesterase